MSQFLLVFISTAISLIFYAYVNYLLTKRNFKSKAVRLIISLIVLVVVNISMRFILVQIL